MRANQLTAEEEAIDLNLPLAQIREAEVYNQIHRALIEHEAEEKNLRMMGVKLEPVDL